MISIDFDGVICDRPGIPRKGDYMADKPMKDALEAIWWLERHDFKPYVLTNRTKKEWPGIRYWMHMHGFPELKITNRKLIGTTIYLAKWAIRFTNWRDIIGTKVSRKEKAYKKKLLGKLPTLSLLDWGYIGGLIDGEGCITGGKSGKGNLYLRLTIANQHIVVLEKLKEWFGGSISKQEKKGKYPIYYWTKSGTSLQLILKKLLDKGALRMKAQQATLAVKFFDLLRYNGRKTGKLQKMRQEQIIGMISEVNQFGFTLDFPVIIDDRAIRFTNWKDFIKLLG